MAELVSAFRAAGFEDPGLEARHLLREAGVQLTVDEVQLNKVREWRDKRVMGIPLAYISGVKGFYKHEFRVAPGVLIPRPETEHVVETALRRWASEPRDTFADLGCGSGCIGLSLALEKPGTLPTLVDQSPFACEIAAKNATRLKVPATVIHSPVEAWRPVKKLSLVVANPPYIAEGDPEVQASVHQFEPHAALYSGRDGLEALRSWTAWSARNLKSGGLLVYEIGTGQSAAVSAIMTQHGFKDIEIEKDLAGHDRVVSGKLG